MAKPTAPVTAPAEPLPASTEQAAEPAKSHLPVGHGRVRRPYLGEITPPVTTDQPATEA